VSDQAVFARSIALSASQSTRPSIAGTVKPYRIHFGTMWQVRQRLVLHLPCWSTNRPLARIGSSRARRHRSGSPLDLARAGRIEPFAENK